MFPLVAQGKAASSADSDMGVAATLLSHAPRLKDAADRVAGALVKSLQKLAATAGAINGQVREISWRDMAGIVSTLSPCGVTSLVNSPAVPCVVLVTLDEMLVYGLVDLLCGGNGSENPPPEPRNATPIDQQFAQIAFTFLASAIETEWSDAGFSSAVVTKPETLDAEVFGARVTEVGCLDLSIGIYGLTGTIRLVMPPDAIDCFVTHDMVEEVEDATDEDWLIRLRQEIGQTHVPLDAYIEGKEIDLASLAALRIGQILSLPPDARARVSLVAQSQVLYRGEIGQADDRYTLRIEDIVLDTRLAAPIVAPVSRYQTSELIRV